MRDEDKLLIFSVFLSVIVTGTIIWLINFFKKEENYEINELSNYISRVNARKIGRAHV